ncbi:MAG: SH3 domain-containing protein [Deltaproteobacteria bacterium]|nr:SH3 domain-containing protein [Deltaproteobacteria bacterium]
MAHSSDPFPGGAGLRTALIVGALALLTLACAGAPEPPPLAPEGSSGTPRPEGQVSYVTAATLANMREAPDVGSAVVAEVLRGHKVVITGPPVGSGYFFGVQGAWAPVWAEGRTGYLFDAFLLPFPAPPEDCADLDTWAAAIGHAGAPTLTSLPCTSRAVIEQYDTFCPTSHRTALRGGGWIETSHGYESGSTTLFLPRVHRDAFWAAARNCFTSQPDMRGRGLPTAPGPADIDAPEATATVEGDEVGWTWAEGCSTWLTVRPEGDGALITYGGGC